MKKLICAVITLIVCFFVFAACRKSPADTDSNTDIDNENSVLQDNEISCAFTEDERLAGLELYPLNEEEREKYFNAVDIALAHTWQGYENPKVWEDIPLFKVNLQNLYGADNRRDFPVDWEDPRVDIDLYAEPFAVHFHLTVNRAKEALIEYRGDDYDGETDTVTVPDGYGHLSQTQVTGFSEHNDNHTHVMYDVINPDGETIGSGELIMFIHNGCVVYYSNTFTPAYK